MPRHRGLYWSQWRRCDRCSFTYPVSQLITQKGMLLCPKDVDNLDVEMRPKIIADILAETNETENELEKVQDDANNYLEF